MCLGNDAEILGKNLLSLRRKHRLTQKEMAKRLGVGIKSLRSLERGVIPERLACDLLFAVLFQFGVPPAKLFIPFFVDKKSEIE